MTLLDALRHQWHRRARSPTWGRNLVATILLAIATVYFGILFVGLGWFYPAVVAEVAPDRDPLRLLNASLLYGVAGLAVTRFFFQRPAGSAVRFYLPLPIRKAQLVRLLQVTSALSLFNLLPVVVLATLWGSTVWPAAPPVGAALWALGSLLAVVLTQFANSLLRAAWDRHAGLVSGGAALFILLVLATNVLGARGLRAASSWLFGGLGAGAFGPLIVLGLATAGAGWAAHRALRARLYDVGGRASKSGSGILPRTGLLGRRWAGNRIVSLTLLGATLILRNKRPRQMLLLNVPVVPGLVFLGAPQLAGDPFMELVFSFLLSAFLAFPYFQFGGHAWHGMHFDALLSHTQTLRTLVQAQFALFVGLCLCSVLLVLPVVAWQVPGLLDALAAGLLYNLGVSGPTFLLLGSWNRTALAVNQTAFFNHQGNSSFPMVSVATLTIPPFALFFGVGSGPALWTLAGFGTLGLCAAPLWIRGLGRLLHGQRHAMAAGFRDTE